MATSKLGQEYIEELKAQLDDLKMTYQANVSKLVQENENLQEEMWRRHRDETMQMEIRYSKTVEHNRKEYLDAVFVLESRMMLAGEPGPSGWTMAPRASGLSTMPMYQLEAPVYLDSQSVKSDLMASKTPVKKSSDSASPSTKVGSPSTGPVGKLNNEETCSATSK